MSPLPIYSADQMTWHCQRDGRLGPVNRNILSQMRNAPFSCLHEMIRKRSFMRTLAALCVAFASQAACADEVLAGRVVGVADGDTITVLDSTLVQHKVRVAGVDAPEKGQPFGNRAKVNLSDLVMGRSVQIQWHKKDRYGRVVGLVKVNGLDAGLEQIRSGLAWHYKAYMREQPYEQRVSYSAAEAEARSEHRGSGATRRQSLRGITGQRSASEDCRVMSLRNSQQQYVLSYVHCGRAESTRFIPHIERLPCATEFCRGNGYSELVLRRFGAGLPSAPGYHGQPSEGVLLARIA